jgi:hypothetical protein
LGGEQGGERADEAEEEEAKPRAVRHRSMLARQWEGASGWFGGATTAFIGHGFPQWSARRYFRAAERNYRIAERTAQAQASCCGVNLASSGFWCAGFSQNGTGGVLKRYQVDWMQPG